MVYGSPVRTDLTVMDIRKGLGGEALGFIWNQVPEPGFGFGGKIDFAVSTQPGLCMCLLSRAHVNPGFPAQ